MKNASIETSLQAFLEYLRVRNFSPATIKSRKQALRVFCGFLARRGVGALREVRPELIREYQQWIGKQGWSPNTIQSRLMGLRRFFGHLEKEGVKNPCAGLIFPKMEDALPRQVLTPQEAQSVLDAPDTRSAKGIRDKAIMELFYSTGIRLGEMARLNIEDVDAKNGVVRVNHGKFAKDRVVPMGAMAGQWVRAYLDVRRVWAVGRAAEKALWLASHGRHGPLKSQMIERLVIQYGEMSGLKKRVTPHVWRHSCATHLVSNGSNLAEVRLLLGHRSMKTTQLYARVAIPEVRHTFKNAHPRSSTI
ncbi:MAG: tyrosine-type recombinase/integrase [Verrucomicrobiae bacterium]|nr:tyrosine-type recombinase/integrase [Verrucomicrobiae bacterium]